MLVICPRFSQIVLGIQPFLLELTSQQANRPQRLAIMIRCGPGPEDIETLFTRTFDVVTHDTMADRLIQQADQDASWAQRRGPKADNFIAGPLPEATPEEHPGPVIPAVLIPVETPAPAPTESPDTPAPLPLPESDPAAKRRRVERMTLRPRAPPSKPESRAAAGAGWAPGTTLPARHISPRGYPAPWPVPPPSAVGDSPHPMATPPAMAWPFMPPDGMLWNGGVGWTHHPSWPTGPQPWPMTGPVSAATPHSAAATLPQSAPDGAYFPMRTVERVLPVASGPVPDMRTAPTASPTYTIPSPAILQRGPPPAPAPASAWGWGAGKQ